MKLRSLAAVAGSLALTGALLVGTAAPANAYVIVPVVFPTCANFVPPADVTLWGITPSPVIESAVVGAPVISGTSIPSLQGIITARQHRTCSWTKGTRRGTISEVRLNTTDFATIRAAYLAAGFTESTPSPATMPGTAIDHVFIKTGKNATGDVAYLSPDGWWVTSTDNGTGILGSFVYDAIDVFLGMNPRLH